MLRDTVIPFLNHLGVRQGAVCGEPLRWRPGFHVPREDIRSVAVSRATRLWFTSRLLFKMYLCSHHAAACGSPQKLIRVVEKYGTVVETYGTTVETCESGVETHETAVETCGTTVETRGSAATRKFESLIY